MGLEPNIREMIRAADGVTYWAKADKAAAEIGWNPRPLEQGAARHLRAEDAEAPTARRRPSGRP